MNLVLMTKLKTSKLFSGVKYAGLVEGRHYFDVAPGDLYPAAIKDIRETLDTGKGLTEDHRLNDSIKTISLLDPPPPKGDERTKELETARLWFTEKLHTLVNHEPMTLHISKDDFWRL